VAGTATKATATGPPAPSPWPAAWSASTRSARVGKSQEMCDSLRSATASTERPAHGSESPALRFRHQEIAKRLHARHVLHFLGINQKTIHFGHIRLRQQADEPRIGRDAIVGQHGDADAVFDGANDRA